MGRVPPPFLVFETNEKKSDPRSNTKGHEALRLCRIGPVEAEPWRRRRLIPVEEMGEAVPGIVRAGRPRSRVGFAP